jgi:prepilin-type N-terminal cleavage/methylation domain-containing protein
MPQNHLARTKVRRNTLERGFSMVELVVVVAVISVVTAISLPNFVRMYRGSRLSNGGTKMAEILKVTRFQAIRRNTTITCRIAGGAAQTRVWADTTPNLVYDPGEPETIYSGDVRPVGAFGVPGTAALAAAIGPGIVLNPVAPFGGAFTFDARGAVVPAGVYVMYITDISNRALGYRAVVLLPSGSIQVWSGDAAGNWRFIG